MSFLMPSPRHSLGTKGCNSNTPSYRLDSKRSFSHQPMFFLLPSPLYFLGDQRTVTTTALHTDWIQGDPFLISPCLSCCLHLYSLDSRGLQQQQHPFTQTGFWEILFSSAPNFPAAFTSVFPGEQSAVTTPLQTDWILGDPFLISP